jgi:hypothetical protein
MSHSKLTANAAPIDPRTSDDAVRTRAFHALLLIASGAEKTSTSPMKRVTEVVLATLEKGGALTSVVAANVGAFSIAAVIKFPSAEIIPQRNSSTTRRVSPHLLAYPDKSPAGKHTLITDDGSSSHEGVRRERTHTPATRMPIVLSAQLSGGFSCPLLSMRSRVGRKPRRPAIVDLDGDCGSYSVCPVFGAVATATGPSGAR